MKFIKTTAKWPNQSKLVEIDQKQAELIKNGQINQESIKSTYFKALNYNFQHFNQILIENKSIYVKNIKNVLS